MFSNVRIMSHSDQTILDLNFSEFDHLFTINCCRMMLCINMVHVMGNIVCTTSSLGNHGALRWTNYIISKHMVAGLVRLTSMQLAVQGTKVHCVLLNGLATPMTCEVLRKNVEKVQKLYGLYSRL